MSSAEEDFAEGFDKGVYGVTHRELDAIDEKAVRYSLAKGEYGAPGSKSYDIVLAWLAIKEAARADESLSISRKALSNSQLATRIAISAIVLSAIMAIQRIIAWLSH